MDKTREEAIRKFFAETRLYQSFNIEGICNKKFNYDSYKVLARLPLPKDMSGRSFLDIGCNAGFYVFEARRRGAFPSVGVDREDGQIAKANRLKELMELPDVEFIKVDDATDIEKFKDGQFTDVIMLSVFHHLHKPMKVLREIHRITSRVFIGEFFVLLKDDPPERKRAKRFIVDVMPETIDATHVYYPTPWSMAETLRSVGWKNVSYIGGCKNANRVVFCCEK